MVRFCVVSTWPRHLSLVVPVPVPVPVPVRDVVGLILASVADGAGDAHIEELCMTLHTPRWLIHPFGSLVWGLEAGVFSSFGVLSRRVFRRSCVPPNRT